MPYVSDKLMHKAIDTALAEAVGEIGVSIGMICTALDPETRGKLLTVVEKNAEAAEQIGSRFAALFLSALKGTLQPE